MLTLLAVEMALNAELIDLGVRKMHPKSSNTRTGYLSKTLLCDDGETELNTPRITQKDSQILYLYAKGIDSRAKLSLRSKCCRRTTQCERLFT